MVNDQSWTFLIRTLLRTSVIKKHSAKSAFFIFKVCPYLLTIDYLTIIPHLQFAANAAARAVSRSAVEALSRLGYCCFNCFNTQLHRIYAESSGRLAMAFSTQSARNSFSSSLGQATVFTGMLSFELTFADSGLLLQENVRISRSRKEKYCIV